MTSPALQENDRLHRASQSTPMISEQRRKGAFIRCRETEQSPPAHELGYFETLRLAGRLAIGAGLGLFLGQALRAEVHLNDLQRRNGISVIFLSASVQFCTVHLISACIDGFLSVLAFHLIALLLPCFTSKRRLCDQPCRGEPDAHANQQAVQRVIRKGDTCGGSNIWAGTGVEIF
ncbi:hypothetical protein BKA65DRAFT_253117 [Rhexocercosporidium sp. MPI-PUGE-AT-0058]|nr:hypothetical protein BKA65DRAFT_253117 [Rhexocercosporidium sp. MPI-PUGE-AT-0058]